LNLLQNFWIEIATPALDPKNDHHHQLDEQGTGEEGLQGEGVRGEGVRGEAVRGIPIQKHWALPSYR